MPGELELALLDLRPAVHAALDGHARDRDPDATGERQEVWVGVHRRRVAHPQIAVDGHVLDDHVAADGERRRLEQRAGQRLELPARVLCGQPVGLAGRGEGQEEGPVDVGHLADVDPGAAAHQRRVELHRRVDVGQEDAGEDLRLRDRPAEDDRAAGVLEASVAEPDAVLARRRRELEAGVARGGIAAGDVHVALRLPLLGVAAGALVVVAVDVAVERVGKAQIREPDGAEIRFRHAQVQVVEDRAPARVVGHQLDVGRRRAAAED